MTLRFAFSLAALALLTLPACGKTSKSDAAEIRIAGASDLVFAMEDIIPRYEAKTGQKVTFVPGSSGNLAAQIREGAPFDVFFSANVKFVDDVIAAGACDGATKALYARGQIVLWSGPDDEPALPATLQGLTDERYRKIALANPDHAPYGAAAKQALQKAGLWEQLEPRIVYAGNIKAAMQFVETGSAEVGIIALSLAIRSKGKYVDVPTDLHQPIDQALAVCKGGKAIEGGRAFVDFMKTPEIRSVMESYGFVVPE